MRKKFLGFLLNVAFLAASKAFYVPTCGIRRPSISPLTVSVSPDDSMLDFRLEREEANPIIRIGQGENEKVINVFGLWCAVVSVLTGTLWMAAMMIVDGLNKSMDGWDPNFSIYDKTGKLWARTWLSMTNSFPTITGDVERLKKGEHGPCLFVANHASWLDIPVLCTVLDPCFKFIAKGELRKVPLIGQQLEGGRHILIDREDRRSQLRTFKEALAWLEKGVPIMAFPEGKRSTDGRLSKFKKGLFSMAVKANVPIVPITLSNTNAVMPTYSYFPVQPGAGKIHVHVGQAIHSEGRTEEELEQLVRQELLQHLPHCQLPLEINAKTEELVMS